MAGYLKKNPLRKTTQYTGYAIDQTAPLIDQPSRFAAKADNRQTIAPCLFSATSRHCG
jgi:hypothetical protein